jgi:phosphatidate cytidylyltransferase
VYPHPWMKRILTAAILIPVVLVLVFLGTRWQWLFTLAVAAVSVLAGWEYLGLTRRSGANPPRIPVMIALLVLFAVNFEFPEDTPAIIGILGLALLVYCTFSRAIDGVMADAAVSIFCLLYTGVALIALPTLRAQPNGASLVTFLLLVIWFGDTFAFYIGRAWGRHKMAPSLSPGKSWEGAIGSVLGSLLAAEGLLQLAGLEQRSDFLATVLQRWDVAPLTYPDEFWYWLVLAVIVNLAAQVGDLAESALKRSANVKDSGSLLPGHGGVLDRIDALLLAAPVLWYAQVIHQRF